MKIRVCSDLHSEFWVRNQAEPKTRRILENFVLPIMEDEENTVLVIAGDLGSFHNINQQKFILSLLSKRFRDIIICGGNHEWYGGDIIDNKGEYFNLYNQFPNIHFDYSSIIDNINFITTTLWTDFNKENPLDMLAVSQGMNDYSQILCNNRKLKPEDILTLHLVSLYNIEFELQNSKHKNVIITHHAPSFRSIPPQFNDSNVNSGYASNLEYMFKDYNIDLWIHGHIHEAQDYFIDNTRILCNPYGYRGYENSGYNPNLIAEI